MKKLTNVSPFILLLFPVFIMMLFAFTISNSNTQEDEVVLKTTPTTTGPIAKVSKVILK